MTSAWQLTIEEFRILLSTHTGRGWLKKGGTQEPLRGVFGEHVCLRVGSFALLLVLEK